MPSAFRDPMSLPDWIELDYYRRVRPLRRLRRLVNWTVLLVRVVALALVVWRANQRIYQAAPVAYAGPVAPAAAGGETMTDAWPTT